MIGMTTIKKIIKKWSEVFGIAFLLGSVVALSVSFAIGDLGIVVEKMTGPGKVEKCMYCGGFMKVGNIPKDADIVLGNLLREGLTAHDVGYRNDKNNGNYIGLLVYRYEERVGGNLGVDRPAGVGFHIHLMENNVLKRVFIFDEDQQSLSENLFNMGKFFRRGARWLTVEDLSRDAINQGLDIILEEHK
jgi:hypothetical protein